tara:strand:- start:242 stop:424 length:183 start_codon:yes stop_codon:yes gene_type:complete
MCKSSEILKIPTMEDLEKISTKKVKVSFEIKLDNDTVIDDLDISSRFDGCDISNIKTEEI